MRSPIEFETKNPRCMECEANLQDAVDGVLTAAEQARFDQHAATCVRCGEMLDEAKRGTVWLAMLRTPRPEPSAALLERIFAETSGVAGAYELTAPASGAQVMLPTIPMVPVRGVVLPFRTRIAATPQWQALRHNVFQPRLAMTAAMAFFSVALTLNLTGVRLNEVHASDLGPAGLRRAAYETQARAARYYGNLKVVYVLESRLEDLRKSREDDGPPAYRRPNPASETAPNTAPDKTPKRKAPGQGTSRMDDGSPMRLASLSVGPNEANGTGGR